MSGSQDQTLFSVNTSANLLWESKQQSQNGDTLVPYGDYSMAFAANPKSG